MCEKFHLDFVLYIVFSFLSSKLNMLHFFNINDFFKSNDKLRDN
jgi:hypothetical protein